MVVDEAINRGDKKRLLQFNINEKPVALQLGRIFSKTFS
jgi:tRNA-dihydrouridine synthase A